MNLRDFFSAFMVGSRGRRRNKICSRTKRNFVALFYPKILSNRNGDTYHEYCKYSLMNFKSWSGEK